MKSSVGTRQNYVRRQGANENKCTLFKLLLWTLVVSWAGFVYICWKYGNFHKSYVTTVKDAAGKLRGRIGTFRHQIPKTYVPKSDVQDSHPSNLDEDKNFHVIFSTDCGTYQDWQTLVIMHSASVVGQKGQITRIASGCDDAKKEVLTQLYKKLWPKNHIHFTPDFKKDGKSKKSYDFYNKPWGVKHWLEFADPPIEDGVVVALLDPDMIFLRPLTAAISSQNNIIYNKKAHTLIDRVALGKPAAQQYGLGAPWTNDHHKKFNRTKICGEGSPCLTDTMEFGNEHYSVGPPYVLMKQDLHRLTETWTQFVPRVFENYPYLLAEMYAYSMAAAHEKLPHLQLHSYMISEADGRDEGWPFIDALEDSCVPPIEGIYFPGSPLPNVLHYCQTYRVGLIGFAKRQASHDIFSCEHPMFIDPPRDIIHATTRFKDGETLPLTPLLVKRNAFSLCVVHRSINAAILDYRRRMCDGKINTDKTYNILTNG